MPRKGLRVDKARGAEREIVGRERRLGLSAKYWNSLPWRPVDVDAADLAGFDDSVFHGLEEIDGSVFLSQKAAREASSNETTAAEDKESKKDDDNNNNKKKKNKKRAREEQEMTAETASPVAEEVQSAEGEKKSKKQKKQDMKKGDAESATESVTTLDDSDNKKAKKKKQQQQKKEKKEKNKTSNNVNKSDKERERVIDHDAMAQLLSERAVWGDLSLSKPLAAALKALDFSTPTPIQRQAVPAVGEGKCDVVGVAETGSGKTLVSECVLFLVIHC